MSIEELREIQERESEARAGKRCGIAACSAASCQSSGGDTARKTIDAAVKDAELGGDVDVFGTGCLGLCHAGPLVQVTDEGGTHLYHHVDEAAARRIVDEHAAKGTPAKDLLATDVGVLLREAAARSSSRARGGSTPSGWRAAWPPAPTSRSTRPSPR